METAGTNEAAAVSDVPNEQFDEESSTEVTVTSPEEQVGRN